MVQKESGDDSLSTGGKNLTLNQESSMVCIYVIEI